MSNEFVAIKASELEGYMSANADLRMRLERAVMLNFKLEDKVRDLEWQCKRWERLANLSWWRRLWRAIW